MPIARTHNYIGGQWVQPAVSNHIEVVDPSTEQIFATVPASSSIDAERAIHVANNAWPAWAALAPTQRADYLRKIAQGLAARKDELAQTIACEVGMPLRMAARVQVAGPVAQWAYYADLADSFSWQQQVKNSLVVREPVGVVGAITPWNFPLNQITLKVAPALLAGCTVVLKPSEVAPINAYILAEVIHEAGLPAGVFNLVSGYGPEVGEVLARHPQVDMVSFTGSTRAGKRVAELAAASVKKVTMELGGKSAAVILEDADLPKAVKVAVSDCLLNSGQTCSAQTRMIVPRGQQRQAAELAAQAMAKLTLGPALAEGSRLGPLVSAVQHTRVKALIEQGLAEGAELVCGGAEQPADLPTGFFVKPTVLLCDSSQAAVAQQEIFGPVLVVLPHDGDDHAVQLANDSIYGLGGGVWAGSDERALNVAKRIRTGQIDVNGGAWNDVAPFGGFKQSGIGREGGIYGLEEFLEYKSLQLP